MYIYTNLPFSLRTKPQRWICYTSCPPQYPAGPKELRNSIHPTVRPSTCRHANTYIHPKTIEAEFFCHTIHFLHTHTHTYILKHMTKGIKPEQFSTYIHTYMHTDLCNRDDRGEYSHEAGDESHHRVPHERNHQSFAHRVVHSKIQQKPSHDGDNATRYTYIHTYIHSYIHTYMLEVLVKVGLTIHRHENGRCIGP